MDENTLPWLRDHKKKKLFYLKAWEIYVPEELCDKLIEYIHQEYGPEYYKLYTRVVVDEYSGKCYKAAALECMATRDICNKLHILLQILILELESASISHIF